MRSLIFLQDQNLYATSLYPALYYVAEIFGKKKKFTITFNSMKGQKYGWMNFAFFVSKSDWEPGSFIKLMYHKIGDLGGEVKYE